MQNYFWFLILLMFVMFVVAVVRAARSRTCEQCGAKAPREARFCPKCGRQL